MLVEAPAASRALKTESITADLVVVGGGLAGVCAAITAARAGIRVVLVQDRPVLGGNGSSEIRLWALGATLHMLNNNRWAREGGVMGELMVENLWRNPEGNPYAFDCLLLEKVIGEPNLRLLLNTAAYEVRKAGPDRIAGVRAFCSQNSTLYDLSAPLFCDASGDGIVGFLSGAAFRMGAERAEEFGEGFAPQGEFGHLLGHSIYFYSKDVGRPVRFVPPSFALRDVAGAIPRYRSFNTREHGCKLWWIEWGGRLDTVHDTETIKWELWKVVYGVWDYIKNSGQFPDAANLTLEWVGTIPGKRESRRFEGPYMLSQKDVVERRRHEDDVAHGGWSIDLHPADGVYASLAGSHHLHSRAMYPIPYRCYFSRNIENLFLAGRIISTTHVAFGTTRVMCTCAVGGQAVGLAAALCTRHGWLPRDLAAPPRIGLLQRELLRTGQHIPGLRLDDPEDLARRATVTASSALRWGDAASQAAQAGGGGDESALYATGAAAGRGRAAPTGPALRLLQTHAQLLPVQPGPMPAITLHVEAGRPTTLVVELRASDRPDEYSPEVVLERLTFELPAGSHAVECRFQARIAEPRYVFLALPANEDVQVRCTETRVTGLAVVHRGSRGQRGLEERGGETFDFWLPIRRPGGHNFALDIAPPLAAFEPGNVVNGLQRPTNQPNAWVAAVTDPRPTLTLRWPAAQAIRRIELAFDTDFDHAMETVQWGHPERAVPFCVRHWRVLDDAGRVLAEDADNHETRRVIALETPATTTAVQVELLGSHGPAPAALFEVRCYA